MSLSVRRKFPASAASGLSAESQTGYIFKLSVSEDEKLACVATQDRCLRLIDLETFALISQIVPAHDSNITDVQAVPNTQQWISASQDGTCKVWDLRQPVPVITVKVSPNPVDAPVFAASVSSTGTCAVACGSEISLFKYGEWRKYFAYTESHFDTVSCLEFSRQNGHGDILISGGDDGLINIHNTADLVNEDNGQCPFLTLNTEDSVRAFTFTGEKLFAFATTESVSVWSTQTGGRICPNDDNIRMHPLIASDENGWGYIVGMDRSGSRLLGGSSEGSLVEFDFTQEGHPVSRMMEKAHSGVVRSCYYKRDGGILTAGEDGFLYEWTDRVALVDDGIAGRSRSARSSVSARPY